ncbi:Tubulin binding cofactor C-like domain [Dillenia turbinata]|uniref:Tubulin binding cofactor C-like domain n=1 Tax=Dillenia turbinata TaxID=194707 RepID=A0AAN8UXG4_9MAGN
MEDEDRQNPRETTNKSLDPMPNMKHLAMIERLSNHNQSRINHSLLRKTDSDNSTRSFLNGFSQSKQSIESELDRCRQLSTSDPDAKFHLDKVSLSISDLEKLVAENSYFLPPYEVCSSLKSISDLKETLEIVSSKVLPKKKFAFRNKSATKKENQSNEVKESKIEKTSFLVRDSPGFRNKEGEILVWDFRGLEMGEFMLSDLNSCELRLMGCLRALFVHRLRDCMVFVGPVMGSILIEEVESCLFVLASHQIRIHHAKGTDFYLRVRSRPIIEDSIGVRFAPYCLSYNGVEKELKDSGLGEETGNWANVDDFKWLRAVQSPNWCILPENERVGNISLAWIPAVFQLKLKPMLSGMRKKILLIPCSSKPPVGNSLVKVIDESTSIEIYKTLLPGMPLEREIENGRFSLMLCASVGHIWIKWRALDSDLTGDIFGNAASFVAIKHGDVIAYGSSADKTVVVDS